MGETFYEWLVVLFTNETNQYLGPDRIVSTALSSLGLFIAYMAIAGTLVWFIRKSVLVSRTMLVYLFAAFVTLGGLGHLGHVIAYPSWLQLSLEFVSTIVSLFTAFFMVQRRHFIISVVFQFKYVIGLLKTLERLDEIEKERTNGDQT